MSLFPLLSYLGLWKKQDGALGWGGGAPRVTIQTGNLIWRNTRPLLSATWCSQFELWCLSSQYTSKETSERHICRARCEKHPAGPWGRALIRIYQTTQMNNSCALITFHIPSNSRNVGVKWALWRLEMLAVVSRNKFDAGVTVSQK